MNENRFGEIEGIKEGDVFNSREDLSMVGIHSPRQAGIDSNGGRGCCSIVLNGGYVDDQDYGDVIIYTGHGGNNPNTKKQNVDQSWTAHGNRALVLSELQGLPVRVTRGPKHKSPYSPKSGYKYCGLYTVTEHHDARGKDGFSVCMFKLEKISSLNSIAQQFNEDKTEYTDPATRVSTTILRIVRDTKLSKEIKRIYNYTCQVCGIRIAFNNIGYAEAAHIRPLGRPHNGTDTLDNLLCLCPNHHVMFDKGHFKIDNSLFLIGIDEKLTIHKDHKINMLNIKYHFEQHD